MSWLDNIRKRITGAPPTSRPLERAFSWTSRPVVEIDSDSRTRAFPRFHSTAGDQLDSRLGDKFATLRINLRGAYTPAQPVTDRGMFAGRTQVLTGLIRAIEDERSHTVIYGERGLGKTSLLHILAETAREARYLVVYVTCGATSSFDDMIRTVADGIPLRFHRDFGPTSPEAERGDTFATLLNDVIISVRAASDLLANVTGTRVIVILDEFDRAESGEFRLSIAELVKGLSDRAVRVQFAIAGVAANLTELISNVPAIQRSISALHVPKMTASEIRELVKNGEPVSGISFDEGAIHAIISRSLGFPYIATLLAHRAGLNAIDRERTVVNGEDVVRATTAAVDEAKARISRRSQLQIEARVGKGMLGAMGALAGAAQTTGGYFTTEDINGLHADPAALAGAKALIDRLSKDDVLIGTREDDFGRTYHFKEDSVPTYLWLLSAQGRFQDGGDLIAPAGA